MANRLVLLFLAICMSCLNGVPGLAQGRSSEAISHNQKGMEYFKSGFYDLEPRNRHAEADQYYELAIGEFNRALGINPNFLEAQKNLARVYYIQKRFAAAADAYKKVTALDPTDMDAYISLALACIELHRYDEAISHLERAKSSTGDPETTARLNGYIEKVRTLK